MDESLNVFGEKLENCSSAPMTGFFRDGCCNTSLADGGSHTLCARLTLEFLEYSLSRGNDLMTPRPEYGFAGLKPGDHWCLCVSRWVEAEQAGVAPPVYLRSTHRRALEKVSLALLKKYAAQDARSFNEE
ncbi:MAG: DUF2237 domain-containing protein [Polyangiaceae bacterium]|nr:DUF2237 domain-containing protein [Polyangiaceae bacterium]